VAPHRIAAAASPGPALAGGVLAALVTMWHPLHGILLLGAAIAAGFDIWSGTALAHKRGRYTSEAHHRGLQKKLLKASLAIYAALVDAALVVSGASTFAAWTAGFLGWFIASEFQSHTRNLKALKVETWAALDAAGEQLTKTTAASVDPREDR